MITDLVEGPPIACTLGAGDFKARLAWIAALNAASLRAERQDGLRLELTYAPEARGQVLDLIRREQECCAFLSFALDEDPSGLRLTVEIQKHNDIMAVGQTPGDCPPDIAGSTGYDSNLMRHGGSPTRMRASLSLREVADRPRHRGVRPAVA